MRQWETYNGIYVGVRAYADDIVLLASSANAIRLLLEHCEGQENKIVFNAGKSKCLFCPAKRRSKRNFGAQADFQIERQPLEFADKWPHLGHIISYDLDDGLDILQRRNAMAGHINNVLNFFRQIR